MEIVRMIKYFAEYNLKEGLLFYVRYFETLRHYIKMGEDSMPDDVAIFFEENAVLEKNIKRLYYSFTISIMEKLYSYLSVPAKAVNYFYPSVSKSLTYSPFYGEKESWKKLYPTPYLNEVLRLSSEYQISPALIYSIMRAETFYRTDLVSPVGALGLMQVMPQTFSKISSFGGVKIKDPFDPYQSMKASAWYLNKLLKRFDGNLMLAVASYNAGPHKVSPWLKRFKNVPAMLFVELIPYKETRNYVKKVMRYYEIYSYLYEESFYDVRLGDLMDIEESETVVNF